MHTQKNGQKTRASNLSYLLKSAFLNSSNINVVDLFQEFHMDQG